MYQFLTQPNIDNDNLIIMILSVFRSLLLTIKNVKEQN